VPVQAGLQGLQHMLPGGKPLLALKIFPQGFVNNGLQLPSLPAMARKVSRTTGSAWVANFTFLSRSIVVRIFSSQFYYMPFIKKHHDKS
jgi:hypothetical protein